MHVEELSPSDEDEVVSFLDSLGSATPSVLGYHYPFYRDMLVSIGVGRPVYLGARLSGRLVGLLPAFMQESAAGTVFSSLPYFGPNAGVLCSVDEARAEIHKALLHALLQRAQQARALSCSVYTPFLFGEFALYDSVMPEAIVVHKFTQYLDLHTVTWSKKINYDLRKAQRLGVRVSREVTAERVETFYTIYEQNCRDHEIPLKPRECVDLLASEGVLGRYADMYFALREGEILGGLLMIRSPLTASYYMPCVLADARSIQPATLLIDGAVQDARARGIRVWNWEGSPGRESGVYQFKKKWGSAEGCYRVYVQTFQPAEVFQKLGIEGITRSFPYYFVYPFDLL